MVEGIYQHYKGNFYQVLMVGTHTENKESLVVYKPLEGSRVWVRPLDMFQENVEIEGVTMPRFRRVEHPGILKILEEEQ